MIRSIIVCVSAALLGLFIQAGIIHSTVVNAPAPDIILILIVFLSIRHQTPMSVIGCFVLGLLMDFASAQFLGPNAAGAVVTFILVGFICSHVFAERSLMIMLIVFISSVCKSFVLLGMSIIYLENGFEKTCQIDSLKLLLAEAIFTALLSPIVFKLLSSARKEQKGFGNYAQSVR